ncbi:TPA: helix-turn-helix transcriptional regulator, partial [Listeria innocua]|nr:helix-turn-helix transcriptional regulator [Listeria innocua]EIE5616602.1 helix-turn-helix transcriptional regulator [Listeria innocua]HCK0305091.1 helix-turn-helix transcriptional regulator [Listeria innocua]
MERIYTSLGPTLKLIRQGKGYTQKYVVQDFMSRSFLAKIESSSINPTFSKFSIILKQLEMDMGEFEYIANDYQNTSKSRILFLFSHLSFSVESEKLINSVCLCKEYNYQENIQDIVVTDIMNICNAILFLQENDVENARPIALNIWNRLSKQDTWYLLELRMLNNIFYLLPIDTASYIVNMALDRLKNYEEYCDLARLKVSFMLNFVQMKLLYKALDEELKMYCKRSIEICKKLKLYDLLAISYIRAGIADNNNCRSRDYIERGFTILESIDQKHIIKEMEKEIEEVLEINLLDL